jgi:hypothetical protein
MTDPNPALEAKARRAARRVGLIVSKTRWRRNSIDNLGGFALQDPYRNMILHGSRYELTAQDVIDLCRLTAETEADYEQGVEQGRERATEVWDDPDGCRYMGEESQKLAAREALACLVFRQPDTLLRQRVEEWTSCLGCEDAYVRGHMVGLREALDEREADQWLTTLPGYH